MPKKQRETSEVRALVIEIKEVMATNGERSNDQAEEGTDNVNNLQGLVATNIMHEFPTINNTALGEALKDDEIESNEDSSEDDIEQEGSEEGDGPLDIREEHMDTLPFEVEELEDEDSKDSLDELIGITIVRLRDEKTSQCNTRGSR